MQVKKVQELFERVSLSDYLPFFAYEDGIYFLKDGGLGFIFECTPLCFLNEQVRSGLSSVLAVLPERATCQFILISFPNLHPILNDWISRKRMDVPMARDIIGEYRDFFLQKVHEPVSPGFPSSLRDFRLFFTVKIGGKETTQRLFDWIQFWKKETGVSEQRFVKQVEFVKESKGKVYSALRAAFLNPRECPPEEFIPFMWCLLNPGHDMTEPVQYNPKAIGFDEFSLDRMCVSGDTEYTVTKEYITMDGFYGRNLNFKGFPETWDLWGVWRYIGDPFSNISFKGHFILTLNVIKMNDDDKGKIRRNASLVLAQRMPHALFPKLKYKQEDLTYGMDRIEKGQDLYSVSMDLFLISKTYDILVENCEFMKAHFRTMGFNLEPDIYINFPAFLSVLPWGYDRTVERFFRRNKIIFEENVVSLAPVFGGWKGTRPEVLFISPTGQLTGFDFFCNPAGGYNSFVIGMTGSGKSVFLQYIAMNYLFGGHRVWIIDIGRSYERFCHNYNGEFIELRMDSPLCLNPFSEIEDERMLEDYLEFLISLLLLMGGSKETQMALQHEKPLRSYLEETIKESFDRYGQESCIDTLVEILQSKFSSDPRVADFIVSIRPYTSEGLYGRFFNGKSGVSFHSKLVVLENDTIENIPDLRDPAIMLLTFHISRNIYLVSSEQKNVVILDEAHKFLGNPKINLFIEQAYRRFRKHGASMIIGTQGFEDIWRDGKSDVGRVIIENSFWKMFLMQTSTSRNSLKKSERLQLSNYEERLMDSVRTLAGEYSEIFICSETGSDKVRLVLSDTMKALFFTNPEVRNRIKALLDQGYSYRDAVKKVAEEMGGKR